MNWQTALVLLGLLMFDWFMVRGLGGLFGFPIMIVVTAIVNIVVIIGLLGRDAARDIGTVFTTIGRGLWWPVRGIGIGIAAVAIWLWVALGLIAGWGWKQIITAPATTFWAAAGVFVGVGLLNLAGISIGAVVLYVEEFIGLIDAEALHTCRPAPNFVDGAVILFAIVVATETFRRRPRKLAGLVLSGIYLLAIWPLVSDRVFNALPAPAQRIVVAKQRQARALLTNRAHEEEVTARQREMQADGKRTGQLVFITETTACLQDDGVELLSTTGQRNLLGAGRVGRLLIEEEAPPVVVAAMDGQEAILVSFQYEEEDPTWSRGVLRCWVDSGHVRRHGARAILADAAPPAPQPQTSAAPAQPSLRATLEPPTDEQVLFLSSGERKCFSFPTCFRWSGDPFFFVMRDTGERIPVGPRGVDLVNKRGDYCYEGGPNGNSIRVWRRGQGGCPVA